MKHQRIIVTGGAGFIGSHIVDTYIAQGHHIAVIDNLATGFRRHLNPRATFYRADIRNRKLVERLCRKEKPHVINHHAAIAQVVKSLHNPLPTFEANVLGTANVLIGGGNVGIQKFIFASTGGAIYGEPQRIPVDESAIQQPLSPYGLSKLLGEELIKFYARSFGFRYLLLRYSNVYGPRQNPKGEAGVIAIFSNLMKSNRQPTIFGDGMKTRDYTYVSDIARANVIGLRRGVDEALNLGWGKEVSDQDIFNHIAQALHFAKPPIYKPFRKGEVRRIALSAKKAWRTLEWKPKVSLKEGTCLTVASLAKQ